LDCCFAAAFADGFIGMDDSSVDIAAQLGTKELGEKGCCVLTASTSTKYALEQEGEDLSVYTRYLVGGLSSGAAALDGKAFISARQLHDYVRGQVQIAAPAMQPAIFNALEGDGIAISKAYVNAEQRYRKLVQQKAKSGKGRLRPSAMANLGLAQGRLGLSAQQAAAIQAEVLKPYQEKAKHVQLYAETLAAEKKECFPLDEIAVQELQELKQTLNLRDEDVVEAETRVLGSALSVHRQGRTVFHAQAKETTTLRSTTSNESTFSFESVRVDEAGKVIETIPGKAEYFTENLGNGVTMDMVRIPAGTFLMGAAKNEKGARENEYPQHEVSVPEFWMGKYAVTQAQWAAIASLQKIDRDLEMDPARFKGNKRPVEQVSWDESIEFCKRLSKRSGRVYSLPSEAQWEYACRANTTSPFHFGETITYKVANYGNNNRGTVEVGTFKANSFGLYDMHGNVWEWCFDNWHDSYKGAPQDGSAWNSSGDNKAGRGGSWFFNPRYCRSACRYYNPPDGRDNFVGFRVSCSAPRTS